jgi:hypothetical protein
VRTNKVEKEHKHGNEIIGRIVRAETLFGLVPGLELLVERLNEVVGDVVLEGLDADMPKPTGLSRLLSVK